MEFLQNLADNSQFPILTAILLGLMMAISPCPLATNITAIGFISKDLSSKKRIFLNGLLYTLGRAFSYGILGAVLIFVLKQGQSIFKLQKLIASYGELFIGPLLILIGLFMLDFIKFNFSLTGKMTSKMEDKSTGGKIWTAFLLGVVFALAFCPYSGVLYFGGLIPLSVNYSYGYALPFVFAVATGLPVIIFAWILAFSVSSLSGIYNKVKVFELWFRRVSAALFIIVGIYYIWMVYL